MRGRSPSPRLLSRQDGDARGGNEIQNVGSSFCLFTLRCAPARCHAGRARARRYKQVFLLVFWGVCFAVWGAESGRERKTPSALSPPPLVRPLPGPRPPPQKPTKALSAAVRSPPIRLTDLPGAGLARFRPAEVGFFFRRSKRRSPSAAPTSRELFLRFCLYYMRVCVCVCFAWRKGEACRTGGSAGFERGGEGGRGRASAPPRLSAPPPPTPPPHLSLARRSTRAAVRRCVTVIVHAHAQIDRRNRRGDCVVDRPAQQTVGAAQKRLRLALTVRATARTMFFALALSPSPKAQPNLLTARAHN